MAKIIPLDERIVQVLRGICTCLEASAVLRDAEASLTELTAKADAADVASLSPLATSAQAHELRQRAGDYRFEADRMEASCSAIRARIEDLRELEARQQAEQRYAEARAERDALAQHITERLPGLLDELVVMIDRIAESRAQVIAANRDLPEGAELLEEAETIARGDGDWRRFNSLLDMKVPAFDTKACLRPIGVGWDSAPFATAMALRGLVRS